MSLTGELTVLIRAKHAGPQTHGAAALFVLDTLACAYGARAHPRGKILLEWYRASGRDAGRRAFLFGALTHVLEMDDLHRESVTHPACVVIPAAWSIAADRRLGGKDFLSAVLQGYEAVCRIGNAVGKAHYEIWHNTATCGPFGAAFAVASLLGSSDEETIWALGNAGTQASGLWQFLEEGAMSKHLHAGRAAESGVLAAELAARGFTGPERILEGDKGFFAAACPDAMPERVLASPDDSWQLQLTSIKPWPSCRHTHPAVEAALELGKRIDAAEISELTIETYRAALDLCDRPGPGTEYEAKFSLQHCAAAALSDGRVELDSFDAAARDRLEDLTSSVRVRSTAEFDGAYPDRWGARVHAATLSGETLSAHSPACKGDPESPVAPDEMRAKAKMLFDFAGLAPARAGELTDGVLALADGAPLPDIGDLFAD